MMEVVNDNIDDEYIDRCVNCNKKQNAASNLTDQKFFINITNKCGHKFCSSCVDRELYKKRQFICKICKNIVTRDKLSIKSLDETEVERDASIRRKITLIYNKTIEDFNNNLQEYNNYQEYVEDLIYNLVHSIDVDKTNSIINDYKNNNSNIIKKNQIKKQLLLQNEKNTIKDEENKKINQDLEYQESIKQEIIQRNEKRKQLNQIMLGESDTAQITSSLRDKQSEVSNNNDTTQPITSAPNPVLAFLNQREEPKPDIDNNNHKSNNNKSNINQRNIHSAGGYDFSLYDKRNWSEIMKQTIIS